ncbi:hypothetical protein A2614_00665 [Candidatus Woesebacteria bacterium RIFOXYD1_FULL_40_21]|uniref:TrpR like protein, YerC/YecD n=1 Tax=Candidatus Woesebacteria bacterium RIFOXYD1_FULL_40_21 TaxID=1802549 RepID=A0A1F8DJC0_9BACT|nr:MAG: hypothetical protein A2614_00665 [Candidatus Woesebacteria bacterium RIFOXYD1_FULL_40_21]
MGRTTFYHKPKRVEKLSRNEQMELMFDLINSFRIVKEPIETANFLQDLLTAKEIKNLAKRLRIAKLLLADNTFEEIVRTLHVSYATITKVSMWLSQGGKGLEEVISKLPVKYDMPKNLPPIPLEFQLPNALFALVQYTKAKSQNSRLEKFLEGVKGKEATDRSLKEAFSEEFKRKPRN